MERRLIQLGERVHRLGHELGRVAEPRPGHSPVATEAVRDAVDAARSPVFAVVLVGGTRAGKSTLLNALAAAEVVEVGSRAATTRAPAVLCPAAIGADRVREALGLSASDRVLVHDRPVLGDKVVIDTPDFDSYYRPNRERLLSLLPRVHVAVVVVTPEKYRDEALYEVIAKERQRRGAGAVAIVLNKTDGLSAHELGRVLADLSGLVIATGLDGCPIFALSAREALAARLEGAPPDDPRLAAIRPLEHLLGAGLGRLRQEIVRRVNLARSLRTALAGLESTYGVTAGALHDVLVASREAGSAFDEELPDLCRRAASDMGPHLWTAYARALADATWGPLALYLRLWSLWPHAALARGLPEGAQAPPEGSALPGDPTVRWLAGRIELGLRGGLGRYVVRRRQAMSGLAARVILTGPFAAELAAVPSARPPDAVALEEASRRALESVDLAGPGLWLASILSLPGVLLLYAAPIMAIGHYLMLQPERAIAVAVLLPLVGGALLEIERQLLRMAGSGRVRRGLADVAARLEERIRPLVAGVGQEERLTGLETLERDLTRIEDDARQLLVD